MPKSATLSLVRPASFPDLSKTELTKLVRKRLRKKERSIQTQLFAEGRSFLGVLKVLAQRVTDTPTCLEPRGQLSPRVAARDKWRRIEALVRLKDFAQEYRDAWRQWKAGMRGVRFPAGTYAMRVHQGALCETS